MSELAVSSFGLEFGLGKHIYCLQIFVDRYVTLRRKISPQFCDIRVSLYGMSGQCKVIDEARHKKDFLLWERLKSVRKINNMG